MTAHASLRPFLILAGVLLCSAAARAAEPAPPPGKYRCYAPPSYHVVGWFDLEANGAYRPEEGAPGRYAFEAKSRAVRWQGGAYDGRQGIYHPPGPTSPGGQRHTIVLQDAAGGKKAPRPECYLTTH